MPDWEERTMDLIGAAERNPEQQALRGEMRAILEAAFEAIPEIYRTVFMLREVEGLSTADAAECMSVREADAVTPRAFGFHLSRCDRVVAAVLDRLDLAPPEPPRCSCPGDTCHAAASSPGNGPMVS